MACAALLAWAPGLFDAHGVAATVWYVAATVTGVLGFGGAILEVTRLRQGHRRRGTDDLAVAIFLGCVAGFLYWVVSTRDVPGPFAGVLKSVLLLMAFLGAVGGSLGVARYLADVVRDPERVERSAADARAARARLTAEFFGFLSALLSLAAAAVGFSNVT